MPAGGFCEISANSYKFLISIFWSVLLLLVHKAVDERWRWARKWARKAEGDARTLVIRFCAMTLFLVQL